jgi:hypothetical protein
MDDLVQICDALARNIGGAIAAKALIDKLLGPSAEYVGRAAAELLQRFGNKNLHDIFMRMASKIAGGPDPDEFINAKVLKLAIEEGSFLDDEVSKEYYAGLLASSFSAGGADDRAVMFLDIVRRMGTAAVATHHLSYSLVRQYANTPVKPPPIKIYPTLARIAYQLSKSPDKPAPVAVKAAPETSHERFGFDLFVPHQVLTLHARVDGEARRRHVFRTLVREELLDQHVALATRYFMLPESTIVEGVLLKPSELGAELFLWVHGNPDAPPNALFLPETRLVDWQPVPAIHHGIVPGGRIRGQKLAILNLRTAMDACLAATLDKKQLPAVATALRPAVSSGWWDFTETEQSLLIKLLEDENVRLTDVATVYEMLKTCFENLSRTHDP